VRACNPHNQRGLRGRLPLLHSEIDDCRWLNSRSREAQFIEAVGEQHPRKAAAGALTFPLLKGPSRGLDGSSLEVIPASADCSGVAGHSPEVV
jgi:hypothetical protein